MMNKLIGFNFIQIAIWFVIVVIGTCKTEDYKHFYSNWLIHSFITGLLSIGIYFWFK